MNHLESAFSGKNAFWRYLVMIAAVFIAANTAGAIPLIVALIVKAASEPQVVSGLSQNSSELVALGLEPNMGLFVMLFPFLAGAITFALLIKPLNNRTLIKTINGRSSVRWGRTGISALIWLLISALYLFVQMKSDPDVFVLNNISKTLIPLVIISVLFIPFQAAFEELLFRGYLMQGFAVLFRNRWAPLISTSVLFGLLHGWNPEIKEFGFFTMMPQYILFGLVFGIITIIDDGIEIPLGVHAANNIFLSVMITSKSSVIQTPAVFEQKIIHPWTEFTGLLIASVIFIILLKYIFKWKDMMVLFRKIDIYSGINKQAENCI